MGITLKEFQEILQNPDIAVVDDGAPPRTPHIVQLPVPTEEEEQAALFEWVDANVTAHRELAMLFHIPNGGYRPKHTGKMLKATGVQSGVPDLMLAVPRIASDGKTHCGLFIELKRVKKSQVSDEQHNWIRRLRHYGYSAVICHGAQDAINTIMAYLSQES